MTTYAGLAILGAFAGTAGSIMTAFSVNRLLTELKLAHRFVDTTLEALAANHGPILRFTGIEKRFAKAEKKGSWLLWPGVTSLGLGFILQAASVLVGI